MPNEPQKDLVVEARELLRRASFEGYSVFPWKIADTDVVDADGQVLLKIWNGYHNGELAAAAPELLRQLCDEVERLRDHDKSLLERERKQLSTVIEIRGCDKCDLCEDHHG